MARPADIVIDRLNELSALYFQLLLLVGPAGSGKTQILREVARRFDASMINVGLDLSLEMLDLTQRQRVLEVDRILRGIVTKSDSELILLDNTELLFETHLQQDPLRLLQTMSRQRKIVASWNGHYVNQHLTYAKPDHPEYRKYPATDLVIVTTDQSAD